MLNLIERFLLRRLEKKKREVIRLRWQEAQLRQILKEAEEAKERKENESD